jgi:RNA polymerase sigma-70 factor, ECF subfamily
VTGRPARLFNFCLSTRAFRFRAPPACHILRPIPATNHSDKEIDVGLVDLMDGAQLRRALEEHHREAWGWALACCARHPADAETVLQMAYVKILEGKARYGGLSSFRTWLFAVVRNTASDYRRREWLDRLRLTRHAESAPPAAVRRFEDDVYRSQVQALFLRALDRLPRRQQEALQLVFYHDLSLAEAAEVMGITIGSARTHYERGKRRLRQLMAESGVGDEPGLARAENQAVVP